MSANDIKLEKALLAAQEKIAKSGKPEFTPLSEKIQYLVVSYRADGNPVGLYEVAHEAVDFLKAHQAANAKHITAKLIGDIAKAANGETTPAKATAKTKETAKKEPVKKESVKKETAKKEPVKKEPAAKAAAAKPAAPKKRLPRSDWQPMPPNGKPRSGSTGAGFAVCERYCLPGAKSGRQKIAVRPLVTAASRTAS